MYTYLEDKYNQKKVDFNSPSDDFFRHIRKQLSKNNRKYFFYQLMHIIFTYKNLSPNTEVIHLSLHTQV